MKRCFTVLSASLLLALATGVGTAEAGLLSGGADPTRSGVLDVSSTIDQTADVVGIAVNVSPNVAVLNSGDVSQSSTSSASGNGNADNTSPSASAVDGGGCGPDVACRLDDGGNVAQGSSAQTDGGGIAGNVSPNVAVGNSGSVSQDSSSSAGGSHDGDTADTAGGTVIGTRSRGHDDGSVNAINTVDQTVEAGAISVNASPNVAALNSGDVSQSSSAQAAGSEATTLETLVDTTIASGKGSEACGCGLLDGGLPDVDSTIEQTLDLGGIAADVSPNVAVLNGGGCGCGGGDVDQSSSAEAGGDGIAANVSPNVAILNGCLVGGCLDLGDCLLGDCPEGCDQGGGDNGGGNQGSNAGGTTPATVPGLPAVNVPAPPVGTSTPGSKSDGVAGSGQTLQNSRQQESTAPTSKTALLMAPVTVAGPLPFTGFDLASIAFGAVLLLLVGVGLYWLGRTTVLRGPKSNGRR